MVIQIGKEVVKLTLFRDNIIVCIEISKNLHGATGISRGFNKASGNYVNI